MARLAWKPTSIWLQSPCLYPLYQTKPRSGEDITQIQSRGNRIGLPKGLLVNQKRSQTLVLPSLVGEVQGYVTEWIQDRGVWGEREID